MRPQGGSGRGPIHGSRMSTATIVMRPIKTSSMSFNQASGVPRRERSKPMSVARRSRPIQGIRDKLQVDIVQRCARGAGKQPRLDQTARLSKRTMAARHLNRAALDVH